MITLSLLFFSHSAYRLPTRKNYFIITRLPIPLVVCWVGKREQKKTSGSIPPPPPPPPPPHTARSEKINKITRRIYRRYAGLGRSRVRTRIPSARRLGHWAWLRKFYTPPVRDNKFPSLVASLFSWRCLCWGYRAISYTWYSRKKYRRSGSLRLRITYNPFFTSLNNNTRKFGRTSHDRWSVRVDLLLFFLFFRGAARLFSPLFFPLFCRPRAGLATV